MKLDHLCLHVRNSAKSRDWYTQMLGLELEFESLKDGIVALKDEAEFGLLLYQDEALKELPRLEIYFQIPNVDQFYTRSSARSLRFDHPPERKVWGYGPQLTDPDGYVLRFYDQRSITPPR